MGHVSLGRQTRALAGEMQKWSQKQDMFWEQRAKDLVKK